MDVYVKIHTSKLSRINTDYQDKTLILIEERC